MVEAATFITRGLLSALFRLTEPPLPADFVEESAGLVSAVLTLSDQVASRAGLGRFEQPRSATGEGVTVPSLGRLEELKNAVTWRRGELDDLLFGLGLRADALQPLTVQFGSSGFSAVSLENAPLDSRPLVDVGDLVVLGAPGGLLAAVRHHLVQMASDHGLLRQLSERYCAAVWMNVLKSLVLYLGGRRVRIDLSLPPIPCFRQALLAIDSDKLLYVGLVTDSLEDYDGALVFAHRGESKIARVLNEHFGKVQEYVTAQYGHSSLLLLMIHQGIGRGASLGIDVALEDRTTMIAMSAAELETIALLEHRDPLCLWKYARARMRIRERTAIITLGSLDEFAFYRQNRHSYYALDEALPAFMTIVGGGGSLRMDAARERDWHAVPSHRDGLVAEVTARYDTASIPIYFPMGRDDQVAFLVEGLPLDVWVIGPDVLRPGEESLRGFYVEVADTLAYWVWQLSPGLAPLLRSLGETHDSLVIEVDLLPGDWRSGADTREDELIVEAVPSPSGSRITLRFRSSITRHLLGPDNAGERLILREFLRGLQEVLHDFGDRALPDEEIAQLLDSYAPLGRKKKLLSVDSEESPELDQTGLPKWREVQEGDEEEVLDEVGKFLEEKQRLGVGPVPPGERVRVLNTAVGACFERLQEELRSLRPDGLLEWLVAHHEATTRESALQRLTLPTQRACFGDREDFLSDVQRRIPKLNVSAMSSRFLIELVVATPPSGSTPISYGAYDRMLALASQTINFGFESDMLHYHIHDFYMRMLPSGRLGLHLQTYRSARDAYLPVFAQGEIVRAEAAFASHWGQSHILTEKPSRAQEIDAASEEEFGLTLQELTRILEESVWIGREVHQACAVLPYDTFLDRLSVLGLPEQRLVDGVGLFTLSPRLDFLRPEAPFIREDVYPWRFNRALSYVRRPFLLRSSEDGVEVLWGFRHVKIAQRNLIGLVLDGRLKAQVRRMQQVMGAMHHAQGEAFNDRVADLFDGISGVVVRRRVKKVGKMRGAAGPPGDTDVLAADTRKRRLLLLECKDLAVARTPHEMANELEALFVGEDSALAKHGRRVAWFETNLSAVLDWLGVEDRGRWRVEGLIVVDQELFTPFVQESPMSVIPLNSLLAEFDPLR